MFVGNEDILPASLLLVEDDAIIGLTETRSLKTAGYQVTHVLSGEAALEAMETGGGHFDLILMDVDLGKGLDGPETARRILAAHDIPIVFLSSHTEASVVEKTERITNYGYIPKSAGQPVIQASIKMAFKLHDAYSRLKRKDEALQRSEEKYQKAFMGSPFAITLSRFRDGYLFDVNESFSRMIGYAREEVIGKTSLELGLWFDPKDRAAIAGELTRRKSLRGLDVRYRHRNGTAIYAIVSFDIIEIEGEPCVIALIEDVTASRAVDLALKDKEAHYAALFNDLSNAVIEEDFSVVKRRVDALLGAGVTDLDAWFEGHMDELSTLVASIRILRFNQEYLRILGLGDRREVAATITPYVPEGPALRVLKDEILALARGDRSFSVTCPNFVVGSKVEYVTLKLSLVSGHEEDWSSVLVSFSDMTGVMKTEAALETLLRQKDMLMRELEHRVKNNLNIVSSLLSLESAKLGNGSGKGVFMAAQSRIRSIALIYDLLSHSSQGDRINCASYIEDLALLLKETFAEGRSDIAIDIEVPDFEIDVKRGVSLGLLVNELLTNSLKYAFPGRSGRIAVGMRKREDGLELSVVDDGVGAPEDFDQEGSATLGMRLVDMLVQQLEGRMELRPRPGFAVRINFPLAET
jgi:PAS domain S-box-containing protein